MRWNKSCYDRIERGRLTYYSGVEVGSMPGGFYALDARFDARFDAR
jgi:hypothetical protein